jgi:SUMO ligase MMS21 Smc5/6 complex component
MAPAPVAPMAPIVPMAPPKPAKYTIETIPQHVIRALLRDAAMYEEECPITAVDIDITNGAVTSCFHLFEKDAIQKWLSLPNSKEKCPVCNTPCNSYTLD